MSVCVTTIKPERPSYSTAHATTACTHAICTSATLAQRVQRTRGAIGSTPARQRRRWAREGVWQLDEGSRGADRRPRPPARVRQAAPTRVTSCIRRSCASAAGCVQQGGGGRQRGSQLRHRFMSTQWRRACARASEDEHVSRHVLMHRARRDRYLSSCSSSPDSGNRPASSFEKMRVPFLKTSKLEGRPTKPLIGNVIPAAARSAATLR